MGATERKGVAAVVTAVLDVMCAMGVVGVALVTGMADVAHAGNRDGLRRRPPRDRAAGPHPVRVRPPAPEKGDER